MVPLGLLSVGEKAEVAENRIDEQFSPCSKCKCDKPECCSRIEDLGLRQGKVCEVLNNPGQGAMLIKVDGSRIAMNRGLAMKIMVRRRS